MARETAVLEAVLFAAGDPISEEQLQHILAMEPLQVAELLAKLGQELDERESGLAVRQVAGGWQLVTRAEYYHTVEKLTEVVDKKLSTPTMETLSIIAFKQPITKQEIEQIRGVRVERALAKLLELELICEKGRKSAARQAAEKIRRQKRRRSRRQKQKMLDDKHAHSEVKRLRRTIPSDD